MISFTTRLMILGGLLWLFLPAGPHHGIACGVEGIRRFLRPCRGGR